MLKVMIQREPKFVKDDRVLYKKDGVWIGPVIVVRRTLDTDWNSWRYVLETQDGHKIDGSHSERNIKISY